MHYYLHHIWRWIVDQELLWWGGEAAVVWFLLAVVDPILIKRHKRKEEHLQFDLGFDLMSEFVRSNGLDKP